MRFFTLIVVHFALFSCGATPTRPKDPGKTPPTKAGSESKKVNQLRQRPALNPILLGLYCPEIAMGRPGIRPLMARISVWTEDKEEFDSAIASRSVKQFSVLGWPGRRAGLFSVAGLARVSSGSLAIGSYQGASVCNTAALGKESSDDASCVAQTQGCALALAQIGLSSGFEAPPYGEDPDSTTIAFGGGCEIGNVLMVDMDSDGKNEYFLLDDLMSQEAAPVELPASSGTHTCVPSFASVINSKLVRLATLDVDGDGRMEILFQRGKEEFLLYGAPNHPARLELLARYAPTSE